MPSTRSPAGKLANARVLILGGTGDIGIAVARALLESGAHVILSSSREASIAAAVARLTQGDDHDHDHDHANVDADADGDAPTSTSTSTSVAARVSGVTCDLAGPEVEANIERLFAQVGVVDHIVYLAGDRLPMVPLEQVTLEGWRAASQVRTIACILVCKVGSRYLRRSSSSYSSPSSSSSSSSIVLTGGSISERPIAGGWAMLALIGAGINGLVRQLAFDLAPVRVNGVAPGVVETELWAGMGAEGARRFLDEHGGKMPTGRVGRPEDLAEAYLYCLKDRNATGSIVHSNSGAFLV